MRNMPLMPSSTNNNNEFPFPLQKASTSVYL